jgi:mRNA interferase MazF
MQRGEIYWVDLNPTKGAEINKLRPCVIVTVTPINRARRTVVVVPLSTSVTARPPLVVSVPSAGDISTVVCDQIRAVDKSRLTRKSGQLSDSDMAVLENGLRKALGL